MGTEQDTGSVSQEHVAIQGISAGVSLASLRALLDPATREAATVDLDLRHLQIEIPAAVIQEMVSRFAPDARLILRGDGLTFRPGGGSPGVRITVPDDGARLHVSGASVRVDSV